MNWNDNFFSLFTGVEDHICQRKESSDESSMDDYEKTYEKNVNISDFNFKYMNCDGEENGGNQSESDDDENDDDSICDSFYSSKLLNDLLNNCLQQHSVVLITSKNAKRLISYQKNYMVKIS